MDVAIINPFIQSTVDTFQTMLNTAAQPGKPKLRQSEAPSFDVSGIIGLTGKAQGSIALSYPKIVALKVVSTMLGMSIKVMGPEVTDAIGEITNIIAGYAKKNLTAYELSISLPNVVMGKNHKITLPTQTPGIVVPFSSALGDFAMEVVVKTE